MLSTKSQRKLLNSLLKVKNTLSGPCSWDGYPVSLTAQSLWGMATAEYNLSASSTHLLGGSQIMSLRTYSRISEASSQEVFRLWFWKLIPLWYFILFTVKYFTIAGAQSCLFSIPWQLTEWNRKHRRQLYIWKIVRQNSNSNFLT